jgi:hypothetical protein
MKKIIALFGLLTLSACNSIDVSTVVPSFWDDNQSRSIITTYQLAVNVDCEKLTQVQTKAIQYELQWFQLYSESKGMLQKDVLELIAPMQKTVAEWGEKDKSSPAYCKLKKQIVVKQAETASKAVLGRF